MAAAGSFMRMKDEEEEEEKKEELQDREVQPASSQIPVRIVNDTIEVDPSMGLIEVPNDNGLKCCKTRKGAALIVFVSIAVFFIIVAAILIPGPRTVVKRTYYIRAEEIAWDYLPSALNNITQRPPNAAEAVYVSHDKDKLRIGPVYTKAQYFGYTDASYSKRLSILPALGILGPTIFARVGEEVVIHFKNDLKFPTGISTRGLIFNSNMSLVSPGATVDYVWTIPDSAAGPELNDKAIAWPYFPPGGDSSWNSGLLGVIMVSRLSDADSSAHPLASVDNIPLIFTTFDENLSPFLLQNTAKYLDRVDSAVFKNASFIESNRKSTINGRMFGNLFIDLNLGQNTYLLIGSMPSRSNSVCRSVELVGNTMSVGFHRVSAVGPVPSTIVVAEITPLDLTTDIIQCLTDEPVMAGMTALYTTHPVSSH